MKGKWPIIIVVALLIVGVSVGAILLSGKDSTGEAPADNDPQVTETETNKEPDSLPQLDSSDREDSATMVLVDTPPVMPNDESHKWNTEERFDACMICHDHPVEMECMKPPADHYYNEDQDGKIFKDFCISCHVVEHDSKTAFNE